MVRRGNSQESVVTPAAEYVKLEKRLVLLAWLNHLFGYQSNRDLLADMKKAQEGFDPFGQSHVRHLLADLNITLRVPLPDLGRYDDNIRNHLVAINQHRAEPITLRYFQYLALLYTEVFLDWRCNRPGELLRVLNEFVYERNARRPAGDPPDPEFTSADLNKLAYWMATGSGKTPIMHFNYRQFLHYNRKGLDNILLITPNEGLTDQHMAEMSASGIPCERFNLEESGLGLPDPNTVRVIEITKLVEEKRGGGVSVPVEAFEGNNLIFVDEGHKGSGGEVWRKFREALGQTGFTFEYSATFGQALTAARNDELTAEYGKCIAFDYSYKYFHGDGYGKDFHILNLREETAEDQTHVLLLGNLLNFYEQQHCFETETDALRPYNLDRPLWVFVGSTVNAVYTENRQKRSDVLTVARFLQRFLENKQAWAVKTIQDIIDGQAGLTGAHEEDVFAARFEYLRRSRRKAETIYRDILASIFHAPAGGGLHLCDIRGKAGELGLKVSGAEDYFGLIYIGDTSAFKKLVEEDDSGIQVEEDVLSASLFEGINEPDTSINVLIGAKKFMEGWNSWRVSNMGLLNIGRSEGSEIIQLFGRGVRLRGLGRSLRRSSALDGKHPEHIKLLETLNIFAVRANYMAQFRDYLEREGIETTGSVEIPLRIQRNDAFLRKGLLVPRLPEDRTFVSESDITLEADKAARVTLDLSLKLESLRSVSNGLATAEMRAGQEQPIPPERLDLIDWETVYVNLLDFKREKGFTNLVIPPDRPKALMACEDPRIYQLMAADSVVNPRSFGDVAVLQETVTSILRRYVERYCQLRQERWETENMDCGTLAANDPNFRDYTVRIPRSETALIAAVTALIKEADRIYQQDRRELPTIYFDRHLYQPLLIQDPKGEITSEPEGLEPSAEQFVDHLRNYWRNQGKTKHAGHEVFLLRNLTRGKGIGFFQNAGFYPDFILWTKKGKKQRVIFIDPHGMRHEKAPEKSDRVNLYKLLAQLSETWRKKPRAKDVTLDSFIVSATSYDELSEYYAGTWTQQDFTEHHILFPVQGPRYDYLSILFSASA
jgi:hypothetical protein